MLSIYVYTNTHMYVYTYMHTEFDTGKHLDLNPGSTITNNVTSGNSRTSPCLSVPVRGGEMVSLPWAVWGWAGISERRTQAAPWPQRPKHLHYIETDTEPVRPIPAQANPQVTRAWHVYPMWRQALQMPEHMQNYFGIKVSQKLENAAILSIHLLKILIQLFYLLQLKWLSGLAEHLKTIEWNKMYFLYL